MVIQFKHFTETKLNHWLREDNTANHIFPCIDSDGCLIYIVEYWEEEGKKR